VAAAPVIERDVAGKDGYYLTMLLLIIGTCRQVAARLALFFLIGLAAAGGRPDSDVQAAVQGQLAKDPLTRPLKLSVTVTRGVAYIVGETTTNAEQARATELARGIEGVKDVVNQMRINDDVLVDGVRKALAADPLVASVPIDVDSRNGRVRLMSDQTDPEQRARAVALASKVDGVKSVEDRMR
jgi:osmotically-inducible protein OsmY